MATYAIIDVETTGGRASQDRITEIAVVLHDGAKVLNTFESLVNPECYIPAHITEITGITNEMVASAPKFYEIARQVVEITEGAVFVAHNVRFDYGFIKEEFKRLGYTFSRRQLCTVRLTRKVFPGLKSYALGNLISHFNIKVTDRHRAMADVEATVNLFLRALDAQKGAEEASHFINLGIKESRLPQGIDLDFLHQLPEACGVYYFYNENREVIYVGKSINIRKRVMEHFADQTRKAAVLQQQVRDVSYELTGSELIALLLESHEIKRLRPSVNRAQRQTQFPYVIHCHHSPEGYLQFEILKPNKKQRKGLQIVNEYPKIGQARASLIRVQESLELCPRLLGLENGLAGPCFKFHIKKCQGACAGKESPDAYNLRAVQAREALSIALEENLVIQDIGRTPFEYSVVLVEQGELLGFGYYDVHEFSGSLDDLRDLIQPFESNPEVKRIIKRYLGANPRLQVQPF